MKTWKTKDGVSLCKIDGYVLFIVEDWSLFRWTCITPDNERFDYDLTKKWPRTLKTAKRQAIKAMEIHKSRQ
jgi:hypothetical protein